MGQTAKADKPASAGMVPSPVARQDQSPVRVLEAIRQGYVGGGESHVLSLVTHLDPSRFHPVVLSFTGGQMVEQLHTLDIPVQVIPSTRAFDLGAMVRVTRMLRRENIALVHVHGSRAAANVIWAARALDIPTIYTIHGWSFHPGQSKLSHWLRVRSEKIITQMAQVNINVSASNQATGRQQMPGFRSRVIHNGIDLDKFNISGTYKDIRQELGIPADHTLVTFLARITSQKSPLELIRAFARACSLTERITLLVVGEGDLKKATIDLASELDLGNRVLFQGFRLDTPDILSASDIYCLPSLWEGLPIGLLEAMAMGNAAIASDVDGTREILRHMENGWLIKPGDEEGLVTAMVALHQDLALRQRLQSAAIATVRERFNLSVMAMQVEEVYQEVLEEKTSRGARRSRK